MKEQIFQWRLACPLMEPQLGWGGCNCRTHVQNSHYPFLSRPVLKFPRLKEHSTVSFMYNTMYIRKALRWHQYLTIFVLYTQPSVLNIEFYLLLTKYWRVFLKTNCQKYVYLSILHYTKFCNIYQIYELRKCWSRK